MTIKMRALLLAAACTLAGPAAAQGTAQQPAPPAAAPSGPPPIVAAPSVRAGVEAWQAENYPLAIANWRPLADRGDADAQYNIAQAYFLGRGVPRNANLAEQWFERAARQGHEDAQANYGLLLFQNGRRAEAMPWIDRAAGRGDPRAQYVLGTTLFNGDVIERNPARAYAMMSRAAEAGLPPAITQLAAMEPHISAEDRARGLEIARLMPARPQPTQLASAEPGRPPAAAAVPRTSRTPPRTPRTQVATNNPPRIPTQTAVRPPAQPTTRPPVARPPVAATAGGRWRVQLGAFSSDANARRAWSAAAGRLGGLQPTYVRAGNVIRVQAGPLRDRAAAAAACARVGNGCFPVAP